MHASMQLRYAYIHLCWYDSTMPGNRFWSCNYLPFKMLKYPRELVVIWLAFARQSNSPCVVSRWNSSGADNSWKIMRNWVSLGENPRISISMCPSGWLFAGQLCVVKCQTGHKEAWLASVGVRDKAVDSGSCMDLLSMEKVITSEASGREGSVALG